MLDADRTLVMGVVNVTPDSFSDGGSFAAPRDAIEHGRVLVRAGADIIDVGGESTRPGSTEVTVAEELARVLEVVAALATGPGVPVSIDTRHATVARACVDAGASVINDVSGFRDPGMRDVAAACDAGLVVMHMLGEPKTMQEAPEYADVMTEVREYLLTQAVALESIGVARDRIALDPGIGFGKTTGHNLELLRRLDELTGEGYPVVVGASRKRFIGAITGESDPRKRAAGSVGAAVWSAVHGARVVRVHDVQATAEALRVVDTIRGSGDDGPGVHRVRQ